MRIAHITDLHALSLDGVHVWDFFNQRVFGGANLLFKGPSLVSKNLQVSLTGE